MRGTLHLAEYTCSGSIIAAHTCPPLVHTNRHCGEPANERFFRNCKPLMHGEGATRKVNMCSQLFLSSQQIYNLVTTK